MIWGWVLITIVLLVAFLVSSISIWASLRVVKQKKLTPEQCFDMMEKRRLYTRAAFEELKKTEITVPNKEGLRLHGFYIETNPDSNKVILLLHGYTRAYPTMMQFTDFYMNQGFNLLTIDQRAHGHSEGKYTSYGYYEKHDIDCWINWIHNNVGANTLIGIHGISLGGGTALEYLHINQHVKFVIADCPYSDLAELIRHQMLNIYKFPTSMFYYTINFFAQLFARFRFEDVKPIQAVAKSELPILFIHGSRDWYIPTHMSKKLYAAKQKGLKRLWIVDGIGHSDSYRHRKAQYEEQVSSFLEEVLALNDRNSKAV